MVLLGRWAVPSGAGPVFHSQSCNSTELRNVTADESQTIRHTNCGNFQVIWAYRFAMNFQPMPNVAVILRGSIIKKSGQSRVLSLSERGRSHIITLFECFPDSAPRFAAFLEKTVPGLPSSNQEAEKMNRVWWLRRKRLKIPEEGCV